MILFVVATFVNASRYLMLMHDDDARRRDGLEDVRGQDRLGADLFQMAGYHHRVNDEYERQSKLRHSTPGLQPIVSAAIPGNAISVAYDP